MSQFLISMPELNTLLAPSLSGTWFEVLLWSRHAQTLDEGSVERTLGAFLEAEVKVVKWTDFCVVVMVPMDVVEEELGAALQEVVLSELGCEVDLAMGEVRDVERDFSEQAKQLLHTIAVGRQFHPNQFVHDKKDIEVVRVLGRVDRSFAVAYVEANQARYADVDDEEMWTTIEAFLASNQNVSETAKRLYVHRNTLIYRLDRFRAVTGLDVRQFEDAMVVKMYRSLVIATRHLS